MPTILMPDKKIPPDWWDHYIFRADTLEALAEEDSCAGRCAQADGRQHERLCEDRCRSGVRPRQQFYDQMFGDANVKPNPCLGPIDKAPYYAVAINLGDLGTKGGLKADAQARVLDGSGRPIPNLYAAGNNAGSPFGNCYPGAGGTIGPALTFGFVAANDIAARARGQAESPAAPLKATA